ncbi:MAG: redoxin domain-containing protein [Pseudomonadota bacterium]
MELMIAALAVLWILVLVLLVVVFALARQVGVLYERIAPAGALMVNQQLKAGDAAPQIAVQTLQGKQRTTGTAQATELIFFLAPDCPICKTLLPVLKTLQRAEKDVSILLISDGGERADHERFVEAQKLQQFDYAISEITGRSFGVGKLPYAVLVDPRGVIAALGIVNSREHLESLFEAERLGIASIQDYLADRASPVVQQYDAAEKG